jgi:hypothetical protein
VNTAQKEVLERAIALTDFWVDHCFRLPERARPVVMFWELLDSLADAVNVAEDGE